MAVRRLVTKLHGWPSEQGYNVTNTQNQVKTIAMKVHSCVKLGVTSLLTKYSPFLFIIWRGPVPPVCNSQLSSLVNLTLSSIILLNESEKESMTWKAKSLLPLSGPITESWNSLVCSHIQPIFLLYCSTCSSSRATTVLCDSPWYRNRGRLFSGMPCSAFSAGHLVHMA